MPFEDRFGLHSPRGCGLCADRGRRPHRRGRIRRQGQPAAAVRDVAVPQVQQKAVRPARHHAGHGAAPVRPERHCRAVRAVAGTLRRRADAHRAHYLRRAQGEQSLRAVRKDAPRRAVRRRHPPGVQQGRAGSSPRRRHRDAAAQPRVRGAAAHVPPQHLSVAQGRHGHPSDGLSARKACDSRRQIAAAAGRGQSLPGGWAHQALKTLSRTYPRLREYMLMALQNTDQYGLWDKKIVGKDGAEG